MCTGQGPVDAGCSPVAQAAEAELIKNKGVVINVSSGVAIAAAPGPAMAPYFIAKASQVRTAHQACTHVYRWCTLQQHGSRGQDGCWLWRCTAAPLSVLQCMQPAGSC
jgi:hypothetical protein